MQHESNVGGIAPGAMEGARSATESVRPLAYSAAIGDFKALIHNL